MTAIILGYSVFQMAAEKILDTIREKNYFKAFVAELGVSACFTVVGVLMILLVGVHVIKR